jgi:hypothetical protein
MPSSDSTQPISSSYAYSILQFVPDPVRNERINVGVLVAADAGDFFGAQVLPKSKFGRIMRFGDGSEDLGFLREFAAQLKRDAYTAAPLPGAGVSPWNFEALAKASTEWANTLQLTSPRGILHRPHRALSRSCTAASSRTPHRHARCRGTAAGSTGASPRACGTRSRRSYLRPIPSITSRPTSGSRAAFRSTSSTSSC